LPTIFISSFRHGQLNPADIKPPTCSQSSCIYSLSEHVKARNRACIATTTRNQQSNPLSLLGPLPLLLVTLHVTADAGAEEQQHVVLVDVLDEPIKTKTTKTTQKHKERTNNKTLLLLLLMLLWDLFQEASRPSGGQAGLQALKSRRLLTLSRLGSPKSTKCFK
jgi:hypothetical protein